MPTTLAMTKSFLRSQLKCYFFMETSLDPENLITQSCFLYTLPQAFTYTSGTVWSRSLNTATSRPNPDFTLFSK